MNHHNKPEFKDEDFISRKHEMPEMTEESFKAMVYPHLHQLKDYPKVDGIHMARETIHGFRMMMQPHFIASFYPTKGEYLLSCHEDAEDEWVMTFDRMFNCSHCINNKEKILMSYPDFFEGENQTEEKN